MSEWAPKRFWKNTEVSEVEGGFTVTLDGRGIKTPAKTPLVVPTRALADELAREWDAQTEKVDPATMPYTRMSNSALDKVALQHTEVADMLAAYGDSDLLCYRADHPEALVERQKERWDPLLTWAAQTYDAHLAPRTGVIHAGQDETALARLNAEVHALSNCQLAAFHDLVSMTGSLVLALAATRDARPADELWSLSRLDEEWQEEQWGKDEDATETAEIKRGEFLHAHAYFHRATQS
ncbi:MAG: ATPase [Pelagimonas sp.]|jgi:chaperone required for assembly of F1-ATPase|nr:ATPase [Pelagimonas sp.]